MAGRSTVPFVGPTSRSRTFVVNNQATVNFMQAVKSAGAKSNYVLETAPGLVARGQAGDGPLRSPKMISSSVRGQRELYGVYGTKLVAQTASGANVNVGTLNPGLERVVLARGRNFVFLVDGVSGYTYDGTDFLQVIDLDFPGVAEAGKPTHCLYQDGFFIVNEALTGRWYISAKEDPTSWNALDFEDAAVSPDNALALASTESLVWVIGDETAQAYYNTGNQDFPYSNVLSATQEVGVLAPYSVAESDDGIFYLATTPEGGRFVYQIVGSSGRVISGDEQDDFLTTITQPNEAYGFIYKQGGKSFYILQLGPNTGIDARTSHTMVYNIKAKRWESRELQDGSAWRVAGHGVLDNKNIGGSRLQAVNMELDLNVYTDLGQELIRRRRSQVYHVNNYLVEHWAFYLDVETGGMTEHLASDVEPIIKLRYSDDGGHTFGSWMFGSLAKRGDGGRRVAWRRLGSSRSRIYEIECSRNLNLTILAAYAELDPLAD